jgi:hypothetical protein
MSRSVTTSEETKHLHPFYGTDTDALHNSHISRPVYAFSPKRSTGDPVIFPGRFQALIPLGQV